MEIVEIRIFSRNAPTLAIASDFPKLFQWHAPFHPEMTELQLDYGRSTKDRQPSTPEQLQDENLLQLPRGLKVSALTLDQVII